MNEEHLQTYVGSFVLLFIFWLAVTWSLHYQSIIAGVLCCVGVVMFCRDLLILPKDRPRISLKVILNFILYVGSLIIDIIKANIQVALIVLNPKLPISPTLVEFKTKLKTDLDKVFLANSITLTPGTLTVDLEGDKFLVHALTKESAKDVVDWHMADKLLNIEGGS